jgi:hypothetical protein
LRLKVTPHPALKLEAIAIALAKKERNPYTGKR